MHLRSNKDGPTTCASVHNTDQFCGLRTDQQVDQRQWPKKKWMIVSVLDYSKTQLLKESDTLHRDELTPAAVNCDGVRKICLNTYQTSSSFPQLMNLWLLILVTGVDFSSCYETEVFTFEKYTIF